MAEEEPHAFYGYYTFDFTRAERLAGMLSVHAWSGSGVGSWIVPAGRRDPVTPLLTWLGLAPDKTGTLA